MPRFKGPSAGGWAFLLLLQQGDLFEAELNLEGHTL